MELVMSVIQDMSFLIKTLSAGHVSLYNRCYLERCCWYDCARH